MNTTTTMTIRVRSDVKEKLDRIATITHSSRSFLAGQAVADYVERELGIIDGIKRGLDDIQAGRLVDHDNAMAEIYAVIDAAEATKGDKS